MAAVQSLSTPISLLYTESRARVAAEVTGLTEESVHLTLSYAGFVIYQHFLLLYFIVQTVSQDRKRLINTHLK